MIFGLVLVTVGILLSAFFSGSETGFYRIPRVRLLLDAKSGNWLAQSLLWLVGRPAVVVATVLIGNNLANYVVSLGLLFVGQSLLSQWGEGLQTFFPVLATPLLFTYGELLPKYLFYNAPYFLSTKSAPLMLLFALLFAPISLVVVGLENLWQRISGQQGERSKYSLERQELQRVLLEGQEAGLLVPVQREMAQNLFTYGVRPVRQFTVPVRAIPSVTEDAELHEVLQLAKRYRQNIVGVRADDGKSLIGCYRVSDLMLQHRANRPLMLPVGRVPASASNIQVLKSMQGDSCSLAQVEDSVGTIIGVVSRERLTTLLLPAK